MDEATINLDLDDLMSTIEALHESLARRLRWLITPDHPARDLPWETMGQHLNWMVNAFLRMKIAYMDLLVRQDQAGMAGVEPNMEAAVDWIERDMVIPQEVLDIFSHALIASSWDEFTIHPRHPVLTCKICGFLYSPGLL